MDWKTKNILIVGLGKTGLSLTAFALRRGARVLLSDTRPRPELDALLAPFGEARSAFRVEAGGHTSDFFLQADLILLSPGIPLDITPLKKAREQGIPVWGELELFARYCATPTVAVTGTNGKTTTTALINELLRSSGRTTFLGGNIGRPLTEYLLGDQDRQIVVAEISSFQLDTASRFRPRVGVLLNITEDHLDRYPDFHAYVASKISLFKNMGSGDDAVLNGDDPLVRPAGDRCACPVHYFSRLERPARGAFLEGDRLILTGAGAGEVYDLSRFPLAGLHNRENALAAVLAARLAGATPPGIQSALEAFQGFGHRLEPVAEIAGVRFYDDSKGTNVGAVVRALEGFQEPVILIAGGRDKGGDYRPLLDPVRRGVKALVLIGEARQKMEEQLGNLVRTVLADSLEDAVFQAWRQARAGDVVLLSPACSSFDMFRDYVHRGEVYQQAVRKLSASRKNGEQDG